MTIPVLETERLLLREHRLDDFEAFAAMWADPRVTRHIADGAVKSREESWTSFLRNAGQWRMIGHGSWAVEEKVGGSFVGGVGFIERKRDRGVADGLELGWMFAAAASGKGYATESLRAALAWGRTQFGPIRVIAVTAPENIASIRVAEKCGFDEFQRVNSAGRPRVFLDRIL